jgi:hypothetical protein
MSTFKQFCEQTWNSGHVNFFAATDISGPKGSRHRANIIKDVGSRKHAQTVPEYKKPDPDIILKVEKLKNSFSHYEPINIVQLRQICKKFKIYSVSKTEPKKLGNTGISIVWDNNLNTFAIKK